MLTPLSGRRDASVPGLVELLGECHYRIRHHLAIAQEVARRPDAPDEQVIQACSDVERYFVIALPLHVLDEEQSIAPRIRGRSAEVDAMLDTMVHQHEGHKAGLSALLQAVAGLRHAPRATAHRDALVTLVPSLRDELEEHLVLEERVLFPGIRALLPHETQALIVGELRQRRVPVMQQLAEALR